MCLITYSECVKHILDLPLDTIWKANSHGAGIITYQGNKLQASKGYMTLETLERRLEHVPKKTPIAIHFRLATHGNINEYNTHPFKVGNIAYLMHNGILAGLGTSGTKGKSDSAHLARILSKLSYKDQLALLDELSGRFLLAHKKETTMHGNFEKYKHTYCSNTYFIAKPNLFKYTTNKVGWNATEYTNANLWSNKYD